MSTQIKMPALSPTMEEGTLAKWLVKEGDKVSAGDIMAEIETDKAMMEFEAVDEGTIAAIEVAEGTEGVPVGAVIAILTEEGEDVADAKAAGGSSLDDKNDVQTQSASEHDPAVAETAKTGSDAEPDSAAEASQMGRRAEPAKGQHGSGDRIIASPLARRIAEQKGLDLAGLTGSGPGGRIIKSDVESSQVSKLNESSPKRATLPSPTKQAEPHASFPGTDIPHEATKLNNVRKIIARRLTEAKQTIPHIYLTVDVRLDALLELRAQLNAGLEADGVRLSVNDLLIKALARALQRVPKCNVSFRGDELYEYTRQDISVAVAAPSGLITPIIVDAGGKGLAAISEEMKGLADKAREGKLQPHEYQGGTASLSNLGMFGTKQFDAVINPPQAMILAVGAAEQRPHIVDGAVGVATVMSATGSFDHRAIDGADGAKLMEAFKGLCENPMGLVV